MGARCLCLLLLLVLLLPLPARAGMSAEEFEAYVTGQTLTYSDQGRVYGIEEYLPGRRVRWSFVGGNCRDGIWYPQGDEICFVYEDRPTDPQCWVFTRKDGRLSALFTGTTGGRELYEAQRSPEPMICPGQTWVSEAGWHWDFGFWVGAVVGDRRPKPAPGMALPTDVRLDLSLQLPQMVTTKRQD